MMKTILKNLTILIAIFGFSNAWAQPSFPTNGLVSYYPLNGNANDYTGYLNIGGTYNFGEDRFDSTSAAMLNAASILIQDVFDPANSKPSLKLGDNNTDFTVAAWVKLGSSYPFGSFPTALAIGNGVVLGFQTSTASQLRPRGVVSTAGSPGFFQLIDNTGINPANVELCHIAFVKSGSQYLLYFNEPGVADAVAFGNSALAGFSSAQVTYPSNQNVVMSIGNYAANTGANSNMGPVDDVFLYNRALNANEIFELYSLSNHNVVDQDPLEISGPSGEACEGEQLVFSIDPVANATGYQWQKIGTNLSNDANYSGVNTNELTITNADPSLSGEYRCFATVSDDYIFSEATSIEIFDVIPGNVNINDNLVHYFPANNNFEDIVGDNELTPTGFGFAEDQYGAANAAFAVNGDTARLLLETPFDLDTGAISAWFFRPNDPAPNAVLFTNLNGLSFFYVNQFNQITYLDEGGNQVPINNPPFVVNNEWYHIVINVRGNSLDIYLDNIKILENASINGFASAPISTIGGNGNPGNDYLGLRFDEIRFYDKALTDDEVQLLFEAPIISEYPENEVNICADGSLNLSVTAGGATSFQWEKDGQPLTDGNGVSGATTENLTISNFSAANEGVYKVVTSGECRENATFGTQVNFAAGSTTITAQPQDVTACEGAGVTFTVQTSGDAPLSYQWVLGGEQVLSDDATYSGTNTNTLIISDATLAVGSYSVIIETSCGNIESSAATLTLSAGQITALVETQEGAELSVNDDYDTYAWFNVNDPSNTLSTSNTYTATVNGSYQVTVTESGCESTSGVFVVDVFEEDPNSIAQVSKESVKIYPNPTQNVLNIELENVTTVEIYSITGVKLAELNGANQYQFNTSALANGLYLVKAGEQTLKFVKN